MRKYYIKPENGRLRCMILLVALSKHTYNAYCVVVRKISFEPISRSAHIWGGEITPKCARDRCLPCAKCVCVFLRQNHFFLVSRVFARASVKKTLTIGKHYRRKHQWVLQGNALLCVDSFAFGLNAHTTSWILEVKCIHLRYVLDQHDLNQCGDAKETLSSAKLGKCKWVKNEKWFREKKHNSRIFPIFGKINKVYIQIIYLLLNISIDN